MKYPKINKQLRREVSVPQLSGGLNLRDGLINVRDNQLTDCVNMWYKDGMLRTRPAFVGSEQMKVTSSPIFEDVYVSDMKSHPEVKNGDAVLVSCVNCEGSYKDGAWLTVIKFFWQYPNKTVMAGSVESDILRDETCKTKEEIEEQMRKSSRLVFEKDGYIYLFLNQNGSEFSVYKSECADNLKWQYINWHDYYVPTVYAHCLPTNNGRDFTGTQFEAYNSLCDSYKMVYSLYNPACTEHSMMYKLAGINFNEGYKIEATIIGADGKEYNHSVEINSQHQTATEKEATDGRFMTFVREDDWQGIVFTNTSEGDYQNDRVILEKKDNYAEDNLIITISPQYPYKNENRSKIFKMTQSVWFGGAANGINGGSRLFLCGNNDDKEKSLVVWSALNNPLYFPENNYAYVGDKSHGVTAFGQQGENLIIFKEKSTYYSHYVVNNNITSDDLINQTVVDYEASSVYFPMVQLNANIGCDCPNTVQLCRNRLVWANSDGNVYTLYSNNQYSERTIYKVSDMIYHALSKENELKCAVSCDCEGHYLLGVGNKIYVMDYNSYGYQYASSYSKTEDSNMLIPWYIWSFDSGGNDKYGAIMCEIDKKLTLFRYFQTNQGTTLTFATLLPTNSSPCDSVFNYNSITDELNLVDKNIKSKLQTKMFDFAASGYLKNIDRVSVGLGNNDNKPINISFISDKGNTSEVVLLCCDATNERDAAFINYKNFYPTLRAVRTLGLKIECEGPLCISGLFLQYRLLGGVK